MLHFTLCVCAMCVRVCVDALLFGTREREREREIQEKERKRERERERERACVCVCLAKLGTVEHVTCLPCLFPGYGHFNLARCSTNHIHWTSKVSN